MVGVMDRSGYIFDPHGLSVERMTALVESKKRGEGIGTAPGGVAVPAGEALIHMLAHALTRPVLVDVTADESNT